MNKEKLIEALETALLELRKPTITFTPSKREPLDDKKITKLWRREVEMSNLEIEYDEFAGIVREIEKAHGIGDK